MPVEEKDIQELKKEVVEARNLVIKTDNLLKNLHSEIKRVADKQGAFERRTLFSTATAYILFAALAALGAYSYAKSEMRDRDARLEAAAGDKAKAEDALAAARAAEVEFKAESGKALELFDKLSSSDDNKRSAAVDEVAGLAPKHLTALEIRALKDKAAGQRQAAAAAALEDGKTAFNRREWRNAEQLLSRHVLLSEKPDDVVFYLLGQSRYALRDFKGAAEALQTYLKAVPNAKSADYLTLLLGESLGESGERQRAIEVYRTGADKYYQSQFASTMRGRAKRLEQAIREEAQGAANGGGAAAPAPAAQPTAATGGQ